MDGIDLEEEHPESFLKEAVGMGIEEK